LGIVWNFLILIIKDLSSEMETNVELVWEVLGDFQRTFKGEVGEKRGFDGKGWGVLKIINKTFCRTKKHSYFYSEL
jgi:hypothetical protein